MAMESLGGSMPPGQPVAVSSGNRSHVFAIAAGGGMNHWISTDGGPWFGPVPLPGANLALSLPAAIALPGGSVHVFAIAKGGSLMSWSSTDSIAWDFQLDPRAQIPGGWNGLAVTSANGTQIDLFAVAGDGKIHHYPFIGVKAFPLPGAALALPDPSPISFPLPTRLLAAVSSAPNKLDVFAVDPTLRRPLHWHFDGSVWSKHMIGALGLHSNSGIAAVVTEPGHIELFGITADKKLWSCSVNGRTYIPKLLPAGPWPLPDGVPAVIADRGRLDVFAIGEAGILGGGGSLVHWRFDGSWSEPEAYGGGLAAGGIGAIRGPYGIDVFAFQSGSNNVLLHWPAGPWRNWAGNQQTDPVAGRWYPTCLEELVAIIKSAAQQNKRVRAVGSSWSFSDIAVTSGYVVETSHLDRILTTVLPHALLAPHATRPQPHHLVHVEAGIQLENLMTILDKEGRAPYTLGGATGQTLAGALSTSVHGSHFRLPPLPDWVRAIHLIGPDGQQHWIEPKDRPITDHIKLQAALGPNVQIHYDDDWFDATLVTVGSLGIIYSVIFEVTDQYMLEESCREIPWTLPLVPPRGEPAPPTLRAKLLDGSVFTDRMPAGVGELDYARSVWIMVDIASLAFPHPICYLSTRVNAPLQHAVSNAAGVTQIVDTPTLGEPCFDPLGMLCTGDHILEALFTVGAGVVGFAGAITGVGPAILAAVVAVNPVAALLLPVVLTPLTIPLLLEHLRKPGAVGDVLAIVLNQHPHLTAALVSTITKGLYPVGQPARRNIAHNLMAPKNRGECAARGLSLEIAFDTTDNAHIKFIDAAFVLLRDEAAVGHVLAGWLSFRFVGRSRAILSPQRSTVTCMVEASALRNLSSTRPLLSALEVLGRSYGGVSHWGQCNDLTYEDVARGYPRLDTWLRVRNQLTNNGARQTFDNDFMARCGLIPTAKPKLLLRNPNDGAIYVIYGGAKFHVTDPATLDGLFVGVPVRDAQVGELQHIGTMPGDGTLLHEESTGKVFVIYGGAKFHVPNWDTLTRLFPGFVLRLLWENALAHIPDCPVDGTLLREESHPEVYVIQGGQAIWIDHPDKLALYGGCGKVRIIPDGALSLAGLMQSSGGWEQVGANPIISSPGACSGGIGRLNVFVRGTDDALYHKWYNDDASYWSDYEQVGEEPINANPAAISMANGRIDVFVRGADNALYHKWYDGQWSEYESLGGELTSGPAVCSWAAGRLDVFARGTDEALWHKWYDGGWSLWEQLGANPIAADPAAVAWGPNRIDVFVRGTDNALYTKSWDGNQWGEYVGLGGELTSAPAVCSWAAGRLDVFARGIDNALWHLSYGGGWGPWEQRGANPILSDPAAVAWGANRIDLFVRGSDNALYHKWWDGQWRP